MAGETKLEALLEGMQPDLASGIFVFATLPHGKAIPPGLDPVLVFREREGRTLVVLEDEAAAAGLAGTFRCRMITLAIHSSLEAVGFLAAITARLAEAGMGVNPVSGFYHDHLFVPAERAEEAFAILQDMAARRDMTRK
ncbi:ACT domain-containing protein [Mesorhizobium sp. SP-1A]|uniref:ACT domain-containing protein n=1 Tax=Mesorhizobium sp. SP-1A TaxID=3077840 RepID=UPI0028F74006|nr:ACT domain-containing protein [Mesorhizobium sp. SP-1A]